MEDFTASTTYGGLKGDAVVLEHKNRGLREAALRRDPRQGAISS